MKRLAALALLALLAACGAPAEAAPLGRTSEAIVRGQDSTDDQDAVVLVMHYDAIQIGGAAAGCTGTLLTPRLVLTARHCVADTDANAACDSAGNTLAGGVIRGDHEASKMFAFAGKERPDFLAGLDRSARGVEIIDDAAQTLCNHDLALVLLDRALPGAKTAPLRLDGGPRSGEILTAVGFGVSDTSSSPRVRQQRSGVKVLAVGPGDGLGPAEFLLGEAGCAGDSGGPAIAETGAVVGALSRGGNGEAVANGDSAGCVDPGAQNVYTSVANYKDLILAAYAKAGQEPWLEGQPDPTLPEAATPAPAPSGGCRVTRRARLGASVAGLLFAGAAGAACARRRRPRC